MTNPKLLMPYNFIRVYLVPLPLVSYYLQVCFTNSDVQLSTPFLIDTPPKHFESPTIDPYLLFVHSHTSLCLLVYLQPDKWVISNTCSVVFQFLWVSYFSDGSFNHGYFTNSFSHCHFAFSFIYASRRFNPFFSIYSCFRGFHFNSHTVAYFRSRVSHMGYHIRDIFYSYFS